MGGVSARVTLSNGRLVIVITGGGRDPRRYTYSRGDQITDSMSRNEIQRQVEAAITYGSTRASMENREDARAVEGLRSSAAATAGRIYGQLHREPEEEEQTAPAQPAAAAPRERERPAAAARRERPAREQPREETPQPRPAARPTITAEWIGTQLRATTGRTADRPATTMHRNRAYVAEFLSNETNRRTAIATIFNELYQTRRFQLFLGSIAGREGRQYTLLQAHLTAQGASPRLAATADESIMNAASAAIRFYLLEFEANREQHARYRQELQQLPELAQRIGNSQRLRAYRSAPLDADTLTAAALYLRRLHLDSTGARAERQGSIPVWRAPDVLAIQAAAAPARATAAAAPAAQPAERTPLEQFAAREWNNLATELYQHVRQGRPEAVGTLIRNLPTGHDSMEAALRELGRTDVREAFDRMFNEFLHEDRNFRAFCQSSSEYRGVAEARVRLDSSSPPASRRLVARAVQAFVNSQAARTDEQWYSKLNDDLRIMYQSVLGLGQSTTTLALDGVADMRTIAAVSLYVWRRNHRTATVGTWAASIPRVTLPEASGPAVPEPVRSEREGGRRRVLTLPRQ